MIITLRNFTKDAHPFGNVQGKDIFQELKSVVDNNSLVEVFGISLAGIEMSDASFPRESVIAIAKQYRGDKGFYLTDVSNSDLIDNWQYGAQAKEQPLVIWSDSDYKIIGPTMSKSTQSLVEFVLNKLSVTAAQVASEFDLSIPNASTRLKNLFKSGYILRSEKVAESGGKEFFYKAIK